MKIIGRKYVCYNRKSDGQKIEGYELHFSYLSKNIEGEGVDKAFLTMNAIEASGGILPSLGDDVEFTYNRFGKVSGYITR